ncbi:hypothetical protein H5410_012542 [Solanum commersonii]|uniref:Uncharacterized protein n=1 Tax=Solanum commersonii TaxID=4109 RepID=A0A9J6ASG9_SOLCO|nr:hypothetical protein H5410_012542 [Solanum commersonii]
MTHQGKSSLIDSMSQYIEVRGIKCTKERVREEVQGEKEKRKVTKHVKMLDLIKQVKFNLDFRRCGQGKTL